MWSSSSIFVMRLALNRPASLAQLIGPEVEPETTLPHIAGKEDNFGPKRTVACSETLSCSFPKPEVSHHLSFSVEVYVRRHPVVQRRCPSGLPSR